MTQDERALVEGLREKIDSLNINLTRMMTLFGGGPGTWPRCEVHSDRIAKVETDIAGIRKSLDGLLLKIAAVGGGIAVLMFLANFLAPALHKAMGLK